jgi:hydrogenase expression/formation protein HypC
MCLAVPGKVKKIEGSNAVVDYGGVTRKVSLGILDNVRVGDFVLVHAGFAIGKVSAEEAAKTRRAMDELDEAIQDELGAR